MKKIILPLLLLSAALVLGGCLTTLHPIFTVNDLVTDPRLAGNWQKEKDKTQVRYRLANETELKALSQPLRNMEGKVYVFEEADDHGSFIPLYYAFLVKLGKNYYMDYYPLSEDRADGFFASHYISMHSIFRIRFNGNNSFTIQQLDAEYLEKLIRNKQVRLRHEVMEDGKYLITASTAELQQYLLKYSDVPEAYNDDSKETYSRNTNF